MENYDGKVRVNLRGRVFVYEYLNPGEVRWKLNSTVRFDTQHCPSLIGLRVLGGALWIAFINTISLSLLKHPRHEFGGEYHKYVSLTE